MGSLTITGLTTIDLDDDLLGHVHTVLLAKLRRHEPVLLNWTGPDHRARQAWLQPSTATLATFDGPQVPALNRTWLERIMVAANCTAGISLDIADLERHSTTVPSAQIRHAAHETTRVPASA